MIRSALGASFGLLLLASPARADPPKSFSGQFYTTSCRSDTEVGYDNVTDTGSPRVGITVSDNNQGLKTGPQPRALYNGDPGLVFLLSGFNIVSDTSTEGYVYGIADDDPQPSSYNEANGVDSEGWTVRRFDQVNGVNSGSNYPEWLSYVPTQGGNNMGLHGACAYQYTRFGRSVSSTPGAAMACSRTDPKCKFLLESGFCGTSYFFYVDSDGPDEDSDDDGLSCIGCGHTQICNQSQVIHDLNGDAFQHDYFLCQHPYQVTSTLGQGWQFKAGQAQFLEMRSGALAVTDFTYEAWVQVTVLNAGRNAILGQGWSNRDAYLGVDSATGKFYFWVGNGSTLEDVYSDAPVSLNTWTHVAATYKGPDSTQATGRLQLYVNGRLQSDTADFTRASSNTAFRIGASNGGSGGNDGIGADFFTGIIDEAAVFNHARRPEEIAADYNPTSMRFAHDLLQMASGYAVVQGGPGQTDQYHYVGSGNNYGYDPYGVQAAVVTRSGHLPMRYGGQNFVQFITRDVQDYTGLSLPFQVQVATVAPDAPSLAGSAISNSQVQWTWTEPYICNPHEFQVFPTVSGAGVCTNCGAGLANDTGTSASIGSYAQSGLGANAPAGLQVLSRTVYGNSPLTPTVTVYTLANAPYQLTPTEVHFTSMTFGWNANGNPAYTPFELSQALNDPAFGPVATSTPIAFASLHTGTGSPVTGLSDTTTYYFRVRARNGNGPYPGGGQATAFNTSLEALVPVPTLPDAPDPVTVVAVSADSVYWSWPAVPTAQSYSLTSPEGVPLCNTVAPRFDYATGHGTCGPLTNAPLGPNQRFGLRVKTANLSGTGNPTAAFYAFSKARQPLNLAVTAQSSNTITLGWDANQNPSYTTYQLVSALDAAFSPPGAATTTVVGNSATFPGLLPGTTYYFRVRALNGAGVPTDFTVLGAAAPTPLAATQSQARLPPNAAATVLGSDNRTQVEIPANALPSGATIFVSVDPERNPVATDSARLIRTLALGAQGRVAAPGSAREFIAVVGNQVSSAPFAAPVAVFLPYLDNIRAGIVDGSDPPLPVASLRVHTLNPYLDEWELLPSLHDPAHQGVRAETTHFSVFALFGNPLATATDLGAVKVYPQPWKPGSGGAFDSATRNGQSGMVFENLTSDAAVKLYTLDGQLVRTLYAELEGAVCFCHVAVWDGRNDAGRKVASGVYLAHIEGGGGQKIRKVAIEK